MKAHQARELKVGDHVIASFGCHAKTCLIVSIAWPVFTLKSSDSRGREMIRTRRYPSIWRRVDNRPPRTVDPSWLKWPKIGPAGQSALL